MENIIKNKIYNFKMHKWLYNNIIVDKTSNKIIAIIHTRIKNSINNILYPNNRRLKNSNNWKKNKYIKNLLYMVNNNKIN